MTGDALAWLTRSIVDSDLIAHYFDRREEAERQGYDMAEAIHRLATRFQIGECMKLATVMGRAHGRDHVVCIMDRENSVVRHAVFATSPQHAGIPLTGHCVDILGRHPIGDVVRGIEEAFGPVAIRIGLMVPDEDFAPGEAGAIASLTGCLPWLRQFRPRDVEIAENLRECMKALDATEETIPVPPGL